MSQYPAPYQPPMYQPPPGYWGGGVDFLAPARRAGILSIVLGAIMLLCGAGSSALSFVKFDDLAPDLRQEMQKNDDEMRSRTGIGIKEAFFTFGIVLLVPAVLLIVFGIVVRRGGMGSIVTLLVIAVLVALLMLYVIGAGLLTAPTDPRQLMSVCMFAVPLALFGLLIYLLITAIRAAPAVRAMREQHHAQYWQQQQTRQMYGNLGGPPPPPPPAPPPSTPPQARS